MHYQARLDIQDVLNNACTQVCQKLQWSKLLKDLVIIQYNKPC